MRKLIVIGLLLLSSCAPLPDDGASTGESADVSPEDALPTIDSQTQSVTNNEFNCWWGCYGEYANGIYYNYPAGGGSTKKAEGTSLQRWEGWANYATALSARGPQYIDVTSHLFIVQKYGPAKTIGNVEYQVQLSAPPASQGALHFNLCITNVACKEWVTVGGGGGGYQQNSTNIFSGMQWPASGTIEFEFSYWIEGSGSFSPPIQVQQQLIRVYYQ